MSETPTPLDLDAIRADLDARVPARDLEDRNHARGLLAEVERLREEVHLAQAVAQGFKDALADAYRPHIEQNRAYAVAIKAYEAEAGRLRAEVAGALQREFGCFLAHDPQDRDRFWGGAADALLARYSMTRKEDR